MTTTEKLRRWKKLAQVRGALLAQEAADNSTIRAFASQDARKIKRLVDLLVRADAALMTCGVGKKSPLRMNIQSALK